MTGQRLLQYEILDKLGEGGMGVVYKARDTTLGRLVAIKVLPDRFLSDHDRAARFSREARTLASLSHPNIAAIFGLDEAEGRTFLAMELAEGETLSHRIARGRIPLREALELARQIAEGMEAAHEKGIVHRDLKPANVMVSREGKIKILDFGLAKVFDHGNQEPNDALTPTITLSQPGAIIGTTAYMSPEQARGRPTGKSSDIWAFGCVLFEMLSGHRAFDGETTSDTLAKILTGRPEFEVLPEGLPARVRELLNGCLVQDPRNRLHDIGDAKLEIDRILTGTSERPLVRRRALPWTVGALLAGMLLGAASASWFWMSRSVHPIPGLVSMTEIDLGRNLELAFEGRASFIGFDSPLLDVSPDGKSIVLVGSAEAGTRLFLRRLDRSDIHALEGTEGAIHAFFSPDGKSIGFLTNDDVKTVPAAGGNPATLCRAKSPVEASWGRDRYIYFSENQGNVISRVPEGGGKPELLLKSQARCHFGRVLPDGLHVLATYGSSGISADRAELRLFPLAGGESRLLIENGYDGRYIEPGHLVFGREGNLFAVDFDLTRLVVRGRPRQIASGVRMHSLFPYVQAGVSNSGVIAYAPGGDAAKGKPGWVDRAGKVETTNLEERVYGQLSTSSDGRRLAIHVADSTDYVLVEDLVTGRRRTIRGPSDSGYPSLSPNGNELAYLAAASDGTTKLMHQRLDDGGQPLQLRNGADRMAPTSWTSDGKQLGAYEWPLMKMFVVSIGTEGSAVRSRELGFPGGFLAFAPVRDWIAFRLLTGEIVLRNLHSGEAFPITPNFGMEPLWCHRSGELYYREGNRWFATKVQFEPRVEWDKPRQVFETEFIDTPGLSYALSPDGQRLLVVKRVREMPRNKIVVLQNWQRAAAE